MEKNCNPKILQVERRKFIKWTAPLIASTSLPVHAACSPDNPDCRPCNANLIFEVTNPAKCSGNPPIGFASIQITSDGEPVEILSITDDAPAGHMMSYPTFPAEVTSTSGVDVGWSGTSSDGTTCLPDTSITLTIEYQCSAEDTFAPVTSPMTVNLIDLLS